MSKVSEKDAKFILKAYSLLYPYADKPFSLEFALGSIAVELNRLCKEKLKFLLVTFAKGLDIDIDTSEDEKTICNKLIALFNSINYIDEQEQEEKQEEEKQLTPSKGKSTISFLPPLTRLPEIKKLTPSKEKSTISSLPPLTRLPAIKKLTPSNTISSLPPLSTIKTKVEQPRKTEFKDLTKDPIYLILAKSRPKDVLKLCQVDKRVAEICRDDNIFKNLLEIHYPHYDKSYDKSYKQQYKSLTASGQVWTFGDGEYGQLGLGYTNKIYTPTQIPGFKNVIQVSCGGHHSNLG